MSDAAETEAPTRSPHQRSVQIPKFAAAKLSAVAKRLHDNPKITLAAAVLAFEGLEPETQAQLISDARAQYARSGE